MSKERNNNIIKLLNTGHLLLTVLSFLFVWMRNVDLGRSEARYYIYVAGLYGVLVYFLNRTYNAYLVGYMKAGDMAYSQSLSDFLSVLAVYGLTALAWARLYNPLPYLILLAGQILFNILWSHLVKQIYFKLIPPKKTVILYAKEEDLLRVEEIKAYPDNFNIRKKLQENELGPVEEQLAEYEAIFAVGIEAGLRNRIAQYCVEERKQGYFLPDAGDVIISGAQHIQSYSVPLLNVERKAAAPEYLFVKRLFDIFASLIGMLILSPFMLITALAIKLYDHGPVFYTQVRLTKDGREFRILKFRSMKVNAEEDGVARLTTENDDRITPVGRIIRSVRMDEVPQLFNILKGEMSVVGPRPERPEIARQYAEQFPAFNLRLQVKAGLTGYAQVYGRYNTDPHDKLQMDLMYINKMGVFTDMMLIVGTLRILFIKESTSGIQEGNITASVSESCGKEEK